MSMEHWCNRPDRGKLKHSKRNQFQFHFVHHKSHMAWLGIEPRFPQ